MKGDYLKDSLALPGMGMSAARSNIKSFLDMNRMRLLVEEELSLDRNHPLNVGMYSDLIQFLTPFTASAEQLVGSHFTFRGNLSNQGEVILGRKTGDENYSIIVGDFVGPLSTWGKRSELPEPDKTKLDKYLGLAGVLHRQLIIKRICKVLGCEVEAIEQVEDPSQLKINPNESMMIKARRER